LWKDEFVLNILNSLVIQVFFAEVSPLQNYLVKLGFKVTVSSTVYVHLVELLPHGTTTLMGLMREKNTDATDAT
jgi:hypothetical protein